MKKLMYLLLALMLVLALCACGEDETTGNTTTGKPGGTTQQPTTGTAEHTHSFGEWKVVTEAACTENGVKECVCECGKKKTEKIAALGHTEVIDKAVAPTCTATGLTEGKHCSVCNEVLVKQETVKANGHTEVTDKAVAPTCTATGLTEGKHCSVCGEVLVKQEKVIVPHEYENGSCVNCGAKQPSEGLLYQRNSDGLGFTVVGIGTNTDTEIVIPETYKDLPVTGIGNSAFANCSSLTSIVIPGSVTMICERAFFSCSSLTSISIPDGVTSIGRYAFDYCSSLTSITIPGSVTSIDDWAFANCSSLNAVYISDLAAWCNIDFGVDCNPLTYAKSLYINGELTTDIVIPDGVTRLSGSIFEGFTGLTSVVIPGSVKYWEWRPFKDCTNLTCVTIENGVTRIGDSAFWGCSSLPSVTIPTSVTSINEFAFYNCSSLTDFYFDGTYERWLAISKGGNLINSNINYTVHCTDGDYSRYE